MDDPPNLWAKARERLPEDVQEWLSSLDADSRQNPIDAQSIDELIKKAHDKQEELEKSRHSFTLKTGKHKLELRPLFENMIKWIDRFKGMGDVVSSFDPVHAALPWAAFRFVLQHLVAGQEHSDKFVKLLTSMPRLLFTGRIFELVYTKKSMHLKDAQDEIHMGLQSLENLHRELVNLYTGLLSALQFCYSFFTKNKAMRKVAAVFNSSKPGEILGQLEEQHKTIIDCGHDCKKISSHRLERNLLRMLEDHQISLEQVNDQVSRILVYIDASEQQETLGKISNIPFQTHHDDVSHRRTTGTCDWITGKEEFHRWMGGSSPVIVLYGIPGAGKTYLTSKVIDTVIASINDSARCNQALAFFYCRRDVENRRNPRDILQSILRQLSSDVISNKCKIHPRLRGLPKELELKGKTFDFFTCKGLIREIVKDYSKITIILDALDECARESREELMTAFDELIQGNANVRIFLSSRTDDDIRRHFQSRPVIEIQTTDNEDDISVFVQDRLSRDRRWDTLAPSLRHEIKQVFCEKSQGMFQWAALQIQQLNKLSIWSKSNISDHLEIAPKGLEAAYDVLWGQIHDMPQGQAQMAQRAFLWVLCAFRPLHTAELSLAMQLDPSSNGTRPDSGLEKETILDICGNLLTYSHDKEDKVDLWRFCHLSAREYIETKHQYRMANAHCHVATASLKFIMGNDIWSLPLPRSPQPLSYMNASWRSQYERQPSWGSTHRGIWKEEFQRTARHRNYILHQALNHAQHADTPRAVDTKLGHLIKQFLGSIESGSPTFLKWQEECADEILDTPYAWISPEMHSSPLEIMAAFGLFHMLEDWWQIVVDDPEIHKSGSPSILSLAIQHGHEPIWRFLTKSKQAINVGYPPPLIAAIEVNSLLALKALIDAGADVNSIDPCLQKHSSSFSKELGTDTPLKAAISAASYDLRGRWPYWRTPYHPHTFQSENEGYEFVRELLANKALVDMETERGSALELAVKHLTTGDALMLLDELQNVPRPDLLFSLAATNTMSDLNCFLVRLGVDVNCRWEGTSPLMNAIHAGNEWLAEELLRLGAKFQLSSKKDLEAVCIVALTNYDSRNIETRLLDFLLASDFDINANDGESDLLSTFVKLRPTDFKVFPKLINAGANVNQILPRSPFATALSLAAASGGSRLFEVLLDAGADPALNTNIGVGTALASAAFHGKLGICRMLLDRKEVDVNAVQGGFFSTVLSALVAGHTKCPYMLDMWDDDDDDKHDDNYDDCYYDTDTRSRAWTRSTSPPWSVGCQQEESAGGSLGSTAENPESGKMVGELDAYIIQPRHLKILHVLFEHGLHIYVPLYNTLGLRSSLDIVGMPGYEATATFLHRRRGHTSYLPDVWFSIAYELQNGPRPQTPIRTRLRECNYPKLLPSRFSFVAKLTSVSSGLSAFFIFLYVNQASSDIHIVTARQLNRQHMNMQPRETRWKRYVPRDAGAVVEGLQGQVQLHSVDFRLTSSFGNDRTRVIIYRSAILGILALFLWYLSHVAYIVL